MQAQSLWGRQGRESSVSGVGSWVRGILWVGRLRQCPLLPPLCLLLGWEGGTCHRGGHLWVFSLLGGGVGSGAPFRGDAALGALLSPTRSSPGETGVLPPLSSPTVLLGAERKGGETVGARKAITRVREARRDGKGPCPSLCSSSLPLVCSTADTQGRSY